MPSIRWASRSALASATSAIATGQTFLFENGLFRRHAGGEITHVVIRHRDAHFVSAVGEAGETERAKN